MKGGEKRIEARCEARELKNVLIGVHQAPTSVRERQKQATRRDIICKVYMSWLFIVDGSVNAHSQYGRLPR